jgi:hypothetical protein
MPVCFRTVPDRVHSLRWLRLNRRTMSARHGLLIIAAKEVTLSCLTYVQAAKVFMLILAFCCNIQFFGSIPPLL